MGSPWGSLWTGDKCFDFWQLEPITHINRIRFEVLHQPIYARKLMSKNETRINSKSQRSSVDTFFQRFSLKPDGQQKLHFINTSAAKHTLNFCRFFASPQRAHSY